MASKIFISYRRDDSAAAAGRVNDRLEQEFGRESLFMDVDAIPLGLDFVEQIGAEVAKCDVLLAIIGPNWLDATDEDGNRRLENERDFVRIEIAAALNRNIPVIPLLLEGTRIPRAERLPDELKSLARRNALDVRHASFRSDMDRLVRGLRGISSPPPPAKSREVFGADHSLGTELVPKPVNDSDEPHITRPDPTGEQPVPPAILAAESLIVRIFETLKDPEMRAVLGFVGGGALAVAAGIWAVTTYEFERKDAQVKAGSTPVTETAKEQSGQIPKPPAEATPSPVSKAKPPPSIVVFGTPAEEAPATPGSEFTDCANCPVMIVVPAGKFIMGSPGIELGRWPSEGPQREVRIAKPFAVSKYEVTFGEWDACAAAGACPQVNDEWGRGQMPVIRVSWDNAKQYAGWLSRLTGKAYRLLTEAEWEYAARAGTTTRYFWGNVAGKGNANCAGCGSEWDNKQTAPVGCFEPNAFGLYDMAGNVWEWVEDVWHNNYEGAPTDGSAWLQGGDSSRHVVRGGSWHDDPQYLRSANRNWYPPVNRFSSLGFRVVRTLPP